MLNEYASNGTSIADDNLMLTENGFLGEGQLGFVYAGSLKVISNEKFAFNIRFELLLQGDW